MFDAYSMSKLSALVLSLDSMASDLIFFNRDCLANFERYVFDEDEEEEEQEKCN